MPQGSVIQGYFPRGVSHIGEGVRQLRPSPTGVAIQLTLSTPSTHGTGQPLPVAVRQQMEAFFGTSFADVRIHSDARATALGALAFTQGTNIHFAPGQFQPQTPAGLQILAHELTHVIQQRAGRVRNPFGSGVAIVRDGTLEAEAERMGRRASLQHGTLQPKTNAIGPRTFVVALTAAPRGSTIQPAAARAAAKVAAVRGVVPETFAGYHASIRPLMGDAKRIDIRFPDIEVFAKDAVISTYMTNELAVCRDIVRVKTDLVEKWKDKDELTGPEPAALAADSKTMDQNACTLIRIWERYREPSLREVQSEVLRSDRKIVERGGLWTHLLSLDALRKLTKTQLLARIPGDIAAWKKPNLRTWFGELGYGAAGNGRLRIGHTDGIRGINVHLTLYIANIDGTASIDDSIGEIMETLLPSSVRQVGTHVTLELFGQDDPRNPHYFKGEGYFVSYATAAETTKKLSQAGLDDATAAAELKKRLDAKIDEYAKRAAKFVAGRKQDIH